jgi:hypothetical protein
MRLLKTKKVHFDSHSYGNYLNPLHSVLPNTLILESRGNRPLKMTFEDQLHALLFFHLQEHESAQDLIQHLKENPFDPTCSNMATDTTRSKGSSRSR